MLKKHIGLIIPLLIVGSSSVFAAAFVPAPVAEDDNGVSIIGVTSTMTGDVIGNDRYGDSVDFDTMFGVYGFLDSVESSGTYSYTTYGTFLAPGEKVLDVFPYTLSNSIGQTDGANLIIEVWANPTTPVANDDTGFSIGQNTTAVVGGNVTFNDRGGNAVQLSSSPSGEYGLLQMDATGGFTYTLYESSPNVIEVGGVKEEVFDYVYTNYFNGASDTAKLTIQVIGNSTTPVANDDTGFSIRQNTTTVVEGSVTLNDRGGNAVQLSSSASGEYGLLQLDTGGGFTYTLYENSPNVIELEVGDVKDEVFDYVYSNFFNGASDTAKLTIQVFGNPVDADGNTVFEQPEGDPLDNVDIEPNNRSKDATPLNSGRNIKGHLHGFSDKDWFSIPRTGDETVSLEVCPQGSSCFGKKSWVLYVFDKDRLTEEMEARTYTFKRWLDDTGSTFDEAGDSIINGISSAGSSNHMYLAHNVGFFEDDDGDGALIGIVDPCFDSSNIVQIGVNNAKTGSALLVAVSSPLERDGGNGCGSGSVVLQQEGSSALGNVLVDAAKEPKTYNTTEEYISVFPFSDDQYTINVAITDQDPLSSEVATAKSATFSVDSGVLKIPRVRAYGEVFEATLNQQNKQARSTNEEALKFVLSELGELSIDEVVDAYRATFNEEKQQVVIPRVTVSETDEAFSVILQYYPAENGNDAWFEVADFKLIE